MAVVQGLSQWAALIVCGVIMARHSGGDIGIAVALAIYAVMPVAK